MAVCEFDQRPEMRWRTEYVKGVRWSHKQPAKHQVEVWFFHYTPKSPSVKVENLADVSRKAYATAIEREFQRLSEEWKETTLHWSSITKMIAHPNYLRIIGLATISREQVERLLLKELQSEPDHWFEALTAITGENPVNPQDDFDEAVNAWLDWGRQRGII